MIRLWIFLLIAFLSAPVVAKEQLESAFGFVFGEIYDKDRICQSLTEEACAQIKCGRYGMRCGGLVNPVGGHQYFGLYTLSFINQRLVTVEGTGEPANYDRCLEWADAVIREIKSNRNITLTKTSDSSLEVEKQTTWEWQTGVKNGTGPEFNHRAIRLRCKMKPEKTEIVIQYFNDVGYSEMSNNL